MRGQSILRQLVYYQFKISSPFLSFLSQSASFSVLHQSSERVCPRRIPTAPPPRNPPHFPSHPRSLSPRRNPSPALQATPHSILPLVPSLPRPRRASNPSYRPERIPIQTLRIRSVRHGEYSVCYRGNGVLLLAYERTEEVFWAKLSALWRFVLLEGASSISTLRHREDADCVMRV